MADVQQDYNENIVICLVKWPSALRKDVVTR